MPAFQLIAKIGAKVELACGFKGLSWQAITRGSTDRQRLFGALSNLCPAQGALPVALSRAHRNRDRRRSLPTRRSREGVGKNRRSTPGARPVSFGLSHDETDATANRNVRCPTCPKSPDAALRPGRERLASARRSQDEPAAGSMAALARVRRAAAGTAITPTESGPPRPLRSEDGCDLWSGTLQKRRPADEQKA